MKKRIIAVVFALIMSISVIGCGVGNSSSDNVTDENVSDALEEEDGSEADELTLDGTVGENIAAVFEKEAAKDGITVEDIANNIVESPAMEIDGATMSVSEGYLSGFNNYEVKGFKEGVMFGPVIGTIPFVGYVFTVEENIDDFIMNLKENGDLRWNVCTMADEMVVKKVGDKVLFVMCPKSFEE